MIVVDESIHSGRIIAALDHWYTGRVISVTELRPRSLIKDDAIPTLLRTVQSSTFITINVDDFWFVTEPHPAYCIVCFATPKERLPHVPMMLRQVFQLPEFKTKAARLGKVARVVKSQVMYYGADRKMKRVDLPK